jgi:hypothetical protein
MPRNPIGARERPPEAALKDFRRAEGEDNLFFLGFFSFGELFLAGSFELLQGFVLSH